MPKIIPPEIDSLILELYSRRTIQQIHYTFKDIASIAGVSDAYVRGIIHASEHGLKTYTDYLNMKAREKGFSSASEERRENLINRGFISFSEYENYKAEQRGYRNASELHKEQLQKNGFPTTAIYQDNLAKKKGYLGAQEYKAALAKKRQRTPKYQKFSQFLKEQLAGKQMSQRQFAEAIGVTRQSVSTYLRGIYIPKQALRQRIYQLFGTTLDDIVISQN
jgi:DNA-binding XRE family transcriptional regulator